MLCSEANRSHFNACRAQDQEREFCNVVLEPSPVARTGRHNLQEKPKEKKRKETVWWELKDGIISLPNRNRPTEHEGGDFLEFSFSSLTD
jgi:hypothetical protein